MGVNIIVGLSMITLIGMVMWLFRVVILTNAARNDAGVAKRGGHGADHHRALAIMRWRQREITGSGLIGIAAIVAQYVRLYTEASWLAVTVICLVALALSYLLSIEWIVRRVSLRPKAHWQAIADNAKKARQAGAKRKAPVEE